MVDLTRKYDVLVVGGGNAALCAAISARREGIGERIRITAPAVPLSVGAGNT